MGYDKMSDFAVASNGHCFVCLRQITAVKPGRSLVSPHVKQINSLQYFTRYLKMDLKKVFTDKEQVSPELLVTVAKARLKVELCEECRGLSERFSEVYRQFEKLKMELGSILKLINGKLGETEGIDKLRSSSAYSNSNWNGLLEVLDILRVEAIHKSSRKLAGNPRVKIQNLSKKDVKGKQKIKLESIVRNSQKSSKVSPRTNVVSHLDGGLETTVVKMEASVDDQCLSDNSNRNDLSCDVDYNLDDMDINIVPETLKMEKMKGGLDAEDDFKTRDKIVPKNGRVGGGTWTLNPETGKRKCNDCHKEFNKAPAFTLHYQTVHLKLRYKCVSCKKLFSNKSNLTLHQRTTRICSATGSAPKYTCHVCAKSFSLKHSLKRHLDGVHYKLQNYECDLCEKKYNTDNALRAHRKRVHR